MKNNTIKQTTLFNIFYPEIGLRNLASQENDRVFFCCSFYNATEHIGLVVMVTLTMCYYCIAPWDLDLFSLVNRKTACLYIFSISAGGKSILCVITHYETTLCTYKTSK